MANYSADDLIFIDESMFNETTGWRHAYSPVGEDTRYQCDMSRGSSWSVLPAMTLNGYLPCTGIREGYYNRDALLEWIANQLLPTIARQFGSRIMVIVLDNCATHVAREIVELIQSAGHLIKYLPPYSPDFNPIKLTFSILKAWVKRHWLYRRDECSNFGEWLRLAVNESHCDQYAANQFRGSAKGCYLPERQWEEQQERIRAYVREITGGDGSD